MSFVRIKTIRGKQYLYCQTSVRKGKKVRSIMEYLGALGAIAFAATAPGKPGGFSGNRPTDKRSIKHQEESDRELFAKSRGRFNVKQRQDYEREQKARDAGKDARDAKMSRADKAERAGAQKAAKAEDDETMEAVREFNEARAAENPNGAKS